MRKTERKLKAFEDKHSEISGIVDSFSALNLNSSGHKNLIIPTNNSMQGAIKNTSKKTKNPTAKLPFSNMPKVSKKSTFETLRGVNLSKLNKKLKRFIKSTTESKLSLPPMDNCVCRRVVLIGWEYHLTCTVQSDKDEYFVTFTKNSETKPPQNYNLLSRLIATPEVQFGNIVKAKKITNIPKNGSVIGEDAPPLDSKNIGNIILCKSGWNPGESLGKKGDGIIEPVAFEFFQKLSKGIGCAGTCSSVKK